MAEVPEFSSPERSGTPEAAVAGTARWPRVIGTLGIIVGALMFIDKMDDLLMLPLMRSREWWAGLMGGEMADLVIRWIPSPIWIVVASSIGMVLGALLVVGALRLRRGRRSGVELCRAWSWLAIGWLLVEVGAAVLWMFIHAAELRQLAPSADWEGSTALAILLVLIIMAAFPVFLLSWFSRPEIKAQFAAWPR